MNVVENDVVRCSQSPYGAVQSIGSSSSISATGKTWAGGVAQKINFSRAYLSAFTFSPDRIGDNASEGDGDGRHHQESARRS